MVVKPLADGILPLAPFSTETTSLQVAAVISRIAAGRSTEFWLTSIAASVGWESEAEPHHNSRAAKPPETPKETSTMKTTKTIKSGQHQTTIKRMDWTIRVYSCETHRHATRRAWRDGLNTYVQYNGSFWMVGTSDQDNTLVVEYAETTETTEPETTETEQVTESVETTETIEAEVAKGKTFGQVFRERIVESLPVIHYIKGNRTRPALAAADLQAGMTVYASGNCVDSIITSVELSKTGKTVTISDRTCGGRTRTYRKNAESIVELANDTREKYRRLAEMAERVKATAEAETVTESEPVAEIEAEATAPEATTQQVAADAVKVATKSVEAPTTTDDADHWRKVGEATAEGRITTFATMDEAIRWVGCYIDGELDGVDDETSSYDYDLRAIAEAITCERCYMLALLPTYDEASDQFEYATLWQVIESHRIGGDDPTDPTDGATYTADQLAEALEAAGLKRWTKRDMDRMYANPGVYGVSFDYYKSGSISSCTVTVDGEAERVSNAEGYRFKSTKAYVDLSDASVHVKTATDYEEHITATLETIVADAIATIIATTTTTDEAVSASTIGSDEDANDVDYEAEWRAKHPHTTTATVWVTSYGAMCAMPARSLPVGIVTVCTGGATETVIDKAVSKSGKTVTLTVRGEGGTVSTRRRNAETMVAVSGHRINRSVWHIDWPTESDERHDADAVACAAKDARLTVTATTEAEALDEPYAPIGWLDRDGETLDVWCTTGRGTYRVTAELDRLEVLGTIHADSDEQAVASAAEAFGACGFLAIDGEQMAYLTNADFDERIITHDEMAEVWHSLRLDGAPALRVGLMRNSVVYFMGQLRDSASDEATRDRYRVTTSAVTCALDCLAHDIERGEWATEATDEPTEADHASDRVNVATRIMALWDEFEPHTYRDALLEEGGDACALRAAIATDPDQLRGLLDEVLDEGTTEQATRALAIIDAIGRLDADESGDSATVMVDEAGEVVDDGGVLVDAEGNIADERDDGVTDEMREVLDLLKAMRDEYQAQEARCEAEGNGMFAFTYHAQAYAIDSAISRIMTRIVA